MLGLVVVEPRSRCDEKSGSRSRTVPFWWRAAKASLAAALWLAEGARLSASFQRSEQAWCSPSLTGGCMLCAWAPHVLVSRLLLLASLHCCEVSLGVNECEAERAAAEPAAAGLVTNAWRRAGTSVKHITDHALPCMTQSSSQCSAPHSQPAAMRRRCSATRTQSRPRNARQPSAMARQSASPRPSACHPLLLSVAC